MAVDWEIPLINDNEGDEFGFSSPLDVLTEGIQAKAYAIEDTSHTIEISGNEITFNDPVNGIKKISDLGGSGGVTKSFVIAMSIALG